MTANPLDDAVSAGGSATFGSSVSEVRAWCERLNSQEGNWIKSVWYYAVADQSDVSRFSAVRIDGLDAEEVRKAARGRFPDYAGWPPDKMRQHVGLVKYRLQMGMSQETFEGIAARWREADRKALPKSESAPAMADMDLL